MGILMLITECTKKYEVVRIREVALCKIRDDNVADGIVSVSAESLT